jgi:hypothetical protein
MDATPQQTVTKRDDYLSWDDYFMSVVRKIEVI